MSTAGPSGAHPRAPVEPRAPPAVVLDTNAMLLPFTSGVDLQQETERLLGAADLVIPSSILGELKQLARHDSDAGRHAKTALRLAARFRQEPTSLPGDDGLLDVARRLNAAVVTNDRRIQQECERSGLRVVVARERGRLAFKGEGSKAW